MHKVRIQNVRNVSKKTTWYTESNEGKVDVGSDLEGVHVVFWGQEHLEKNIIFI